MANVRSESFRLVVLIQPRGIVYGQLPQQRSLSA